MGADWPDYKMHTESTDNIWRTALISCRTDSGYVRGAGGETGAICDNHVVGTSKLLRT